MNKISLLALSALCAAGCGGNNDKPAPASSANEPSPVSPTAELLIEFSAVEDAVWKDCNPQTTYVLLGSPAAQIELEYEIGKDSVIATVEFADARETPQTTSRLLGSEPAPAGLCGDLDALLVDIRCTSAATDTPLTCPRVRYRGEDVFASFDVTLKGEAP